MQARRRVRRIAGLAAALLLAAGISAAILGLAAAPAAAHANLVETSPASGAELDAPPAEVRLRFSERVTTADDGVALRDADGVAVSTEPSRVSTEDPSQVVLPVPADLAQGSYVVSFRVVSADSHPISGAIVFGVGVAAGSLDEVDLSTEDPAVATVFGASRWTSYAGLSLLGGGLAVLAWCWPGGWASRRARRVLAAGWVASLAGGVAVLLLQGPYTAGRSLAGLVDPALLAATLETDYGRWVLARLGLVLLAGLLVVVGTRVTRAGPRTTGAVLVAVLLPATWVGTGHANASDNPLDKLAEFTHLVAMSTWFGGLAVLITSLLPRNVGAPPGELASALRRFSLLATGAVVTLVGTGTYIAWRRVGTLDALLGTPYGRLLAFKLAVLGVLLWLGAMSRSVVQRRYAAAAAALPDPDSARASRSKRRAARSAQAGELTDRAQLRQSVRLEVGTAVAVLAVASVLVATPPGVVVSAGEAQAAQAAAPPSPVFAEVAFDGGMAIVQVTPAQVGANQLSVELVAVSGEPVEVPEIRASLMLPAADLGPLPVELTEVEPGGYRAVDAQLPAAGEWLLDLTIRTSEIDSSTVQVDVPVS